MFQIGTRAIGQGAPAYVVAEMAWSHDGSLDKAKIIIDGAAAAGADAINFHLTHLPDYMVPFYGAGPGRVSGGNDILDVYRYLERINLDFDAMLEMFKHAKARGLAVSAMCNDPASREFAARKIAPDMLMIHPSSIHDEAFVRSMAAAGTPLVLYTGGLHLAEIERAIEWARAESNDKLVLQHGFQSYPTALEDNRLHYIATLKRLFGLPVAFADHTDGNDPMAMIVPLLALAMGADMVEKHITHDRAARGEDYESALGPAEFKTFVQRVRASELAFGSDAWRPLSERENKYRDVVRKRAVTAVAVPKGTKITHQMVAYKRCDIGLFPEELVGLLGHVEAARDLEVNTPIQWAVLA